MDEKKVIAKLIKIAENQQKIIMKLAQGGIQPATPMLKDKTPSSPPPPPPPQNLDPAHISLDVGKTVMDALSTQAKSLIKSITPYAGNTLKVAFNGTPSQAGLDAVTDTVKKLQAQKPPAIPPIPYAVVVA